MKVTNEISIREGGWEFLVVESHKENKNLVILKILPANVSVTVLADELKAAIVNATTK